MTHGVPVRHEGEVQVVPFRLHLVQVLLQRIFLGRNRPDLFQSTIGNLGVTRDDTTIDQTSETLHDHQLLKLFGRLHIHARAVNGLFSGTTSQQVLERQKQSGFY